MARDIIEVLLGTAMHPWEVLALRSRDSTDGPNGMVARVNGTVVQGKGSGTVRQDHQKTDASIRRIAGIHVNSGSEGTQDVRHVTATWTITQG